MARYDNTNIKRDRDTKRRMFVTTLYPKIQQDGSDIYITSREGDRLDNLAFDYYGNVELWWIIAQANAIGKGTLCIDADLQLRIPQNVDDIIQDYNDLNETR